MLFLNNKALLVLLFISAPLAQAKTTMPAPTEPRIPVIQNLTDSLDFLNIIKEKKLPVEAIALQTALNRIIDLWNAQNENMVNDIYTIMNILPEEFTERAHEYRERLSDIRLQNKDARAAINQNLSIQKIIAFGEKLQAERQALEPILNDIIDFTSVFTNQKAMTKTANRLDLIMKDEKKIRIMLPEVKGVLFTQLVKQAQTFIKNANQLNKKAVELLALGNAERRAEVTDEGITIDSLITQSENNIKAAYANFLGMSKLIKK